MKAVVFLADGFEECEGLIVVDVLRRAGVETVMASVMERLEILTSREIRVIADSLIEDIDFGTVDMVILPGGRLGTENLSASEIVRDQCCTFASEKYAAAICAAPSLFAELGLLEGKSATCHPDFESKVLESGNVTLTHESITRDGRIITGQGLGASFPFAFELVKILAGEEKVEEIKRAICYRG